MIHAFIATALADYRTCLVWQATDGSDKGEPLSPDIEWSDEASEQARIDVTDFVANNWRDVKGLDAGQVGHDFCLTRNGHGTGFWDRGYGAVGDRLSDACKPYGETCEYVGDDGLLYLM